MPPPQVAKMLARAMGFLMILLALIGFIPNPLIGAEGYFLTDLVLNGILLLAFMTKGEATATTGLFFGAMIAVALAVAGSVQVLEYPAGVVVTLWDLVRCNLETVYLYWRNGRRYGNLWNDEYVIASGDARLGCANSISV